MNDFTFSSLKHWVWWTWFLVYLYNSIHMYLYLWLQQEKNTTSNLIFQTREFKKSSANRQWLCFIILIFHSNRFWVKSQSSFHKNSWWYLVVFHSNHNFVLHCKLGCLFDSWKNDHSDWKCWGFIQTKRYCLWNFVWRINNDILQRFKNWSLSKGICK